MDPSTREPRRIVATYDYRDELDHHVVFQKVRFEPKSFAYRYRLDTWEEISRARWPDQVRTPEGLEYFDWGKPLGADRYIYRLPFVDIAKGMGQPIWWTEGEKDADALVDRGICATSHHGGALEVYMHQCEWLRGAGRVVIVADRDPVGALDAMIRFTGLRFIVGEVRIVRAREGKDATDHFGAGYGLDDFVPCDPATVRKAARKYRPPLPLDSAGRYVYTSETAELYRYLQENLGPRGEMWKPKRIQATQ